MTTHEKLDCSEVFAAIDYEDCSCTLSCVAFQLEGVARWCPDVWAPKETRKTWREQHATA